MLSKWFPDTFTAIRRVVLAALLVLYVVFLVFFNQIPKTTIVDYSGRTFARASVVEIVKDNLASNGQRYGNQIVNLQVLEGKYKGRVMTATSSDGFLVGAVCKVGMEVVAMISVSGDTSVVTVYSPNRQVALYGFVGAFLLVLWMVGGKKGIRSAIALLFTFSSIIFLYLPMIYRGFSPFWGAVLISVFTTIVSLYIIGGYTVKVLSGILGTIFGIVIAGVAAALFGQVAGISGYNVSNIDTLVLIGQNTHIQIGDLLFAGILFSSLGAVMDVGYSIASAIDEISEQNATISPKQLFMSGIHVGRDMTGTMCNTLILAFAGGMLSTLVTLYAYNQPFLQTINSYDVGIDIMESLSGSFGVILAVPMVALVSSRLIPILRTRRLKKQMLQKTSGTPTDLVH
ncbi:YibE/F family protein [Ethanoligenens harbinense]|uniref:YibE/F family protein n=1 Tax=Ethanoligenens harbinense (strain DSM 18485 / JCM 12961 / CGMCC 1.5033 / YUAN-3) TaxID=663278 RepID=E6U628_ETHHY|nr:YibE/F family protein [Ethanoligenens harbinense]ADU25707.1 YibE/F family protein [Ethanoligenens harbinense YUAN-3]AVQ94881.1 YibE/F family protein [Ethanoligenens harbinense YUAN-3]AYF37572.1 YibE/F family protein [Ethanoligenens harbinense]AYF40292.1 YibE/F family protein [Ethanoligenens harbinense]QCN91129.1 YibE/F family protein [Ethanoligenens harbinense]